MREKINAAVAEVREEVVVGRLRWCAADVKRLILPYPAKPAVDAILEHMADNTSIALEGHQYEDNDDDTGSDASGSGSDERAGRSGGADERDGDVVGVAGVASDAVADVARDATAVAVSTSGEAAQLAVRSMELISTLEIAITALRECGAMRAVVNLENEVAK